jgi:hypothetical protein
MGVEGPLSGDNLLTARTSELHLGTIYCFLGWSAFVFDQGTRGEEGEERGLSGSRNGSAEPAFVGNSLVSNFDNSWIGRMIVLEICYLSYR